MNTVKNVSKGCQHGLSLMEHTVRHVEPFEKVTKIGYRLIDFVAVLQGAIAAPLALLSTRLKGAADVFESIRFFGAVKELSYPNKEGKYFLTNPSNTWQKCTDRVCLAAHTGLKMVGSFNKYKLIDLGIVGKVSIGQLPVFKFATDGFIILSSFFGGWDATIKGLPNSRKMGTLAHSKIDKWLELPTVIAFVRMRDETVISELKVRYEKRAFEKRDEKAQRDKELEPLKKQALAYNDILQKVKDGTIELPKKGLFNRQTKEEIQSIYSAKLKDVEKTIAKLEKAQQKCESRIACCDARIKKIVFHDYKGLADDLAKKDVNFKLSKWEWEKETAAINENKAWLKIANSVGKIAVVSLALALTAINLWTIPWLLSLLGLGIVVESIGLTKILYDDSYVEEKILATRPTPSITPKVAAK